MYSLNSVLSRIRERNELIIGKAPVDVESSAKALSVLMSPPARALTIRYCKYMLLIFIFQGRAPPDMKDDQFSERYQELRRQLADTGYVCTGSISTVYRKCGKSYCACAKNDRMLHGPYNAWTRKVKGKTVTRNLTDEQAVFCRQCISNLRRLEEIIDNMKALTAEYIETYRTDQ
jgi:hypothetical protein